jgi:DNA-directed RNA polymerase specialized sigma24 family protein
MLSKFSGYSFREEIVSDGIENSIQYFQNFDPAKSSNPFAYFTQIMYYAAYRRITKEEKIRYTLYKRFQESMLDNAELFVDSDDTSLVSASMYDNLNDFIERFEAKDAKKREKRKQYKKEGLQQFFGEEEIDSEDKV